MLLLMAALWVLDQSDDANTILFAHQARHPEAISILNLSEVNRVKFPRNPLSSLEDTSIVTDYISYDPAIPKPLVQIIFGGFNHDVISVDGLILVSAHFRRVANFPPEAATYHDIDCTACHPDAQAKDYKMLWVGAVRNGIKKVVRGPYDPRLDPRIAAIGPGLVVQIQLREDFAPDVDIFMMQDFRSYFVTDALATRLLQNNVTGIEFQDITTDTRTTADGKSPIKTIPASP